MLSELQKARIQYQPVIPAVLQTSVDFEQEPVAQAVVPPPPFPTISTFKALRAVAKATTVARPLRVGVVFSGGQAAGGHNVICGLFDALPIGSVLYGFLNGPAGIVKQKSVELTKEMLHDFRNQGGFDLIGSGRTKIETTSQFEAALKSVQDLKLDGLVIIGGDDSNTNAAYLAEFFLQRGVKCSVIGVPKTIDGDLQGKGIEISFGFDTACKIYSEAIGNTARDAISAKKYYYFIKLMGRSASHIALECALKVHPNLTLIGEEILAEQQTLPQVVKSICDLVCERAAAGKDYGVILIPEGVIEFLIDIKELIAELNTLLLDKNSDFQKLEMGLSIASKACFQLIPESIQRQLTMDRDPHGNVQVSKIETERLLMALVESELEKRKQKGEGGYAGTFSAQPIFCGYEGRCGLPSNFDANYCYSLGRLAAMLIEHGKTGYIATLSGLTQPVTQWRAGAVPLAALMHQEMRAGVEKYVIKKALVDLKGKPFLHFANERAKWRLEDAYTQPGPIQFFGPAELTDSVPCSLRCE